MYKQDLVLNNRQWLIWHKTLLHQTKMECIALAFEQTPVNMY